MTWKQVRPFFMPNAIEQLTNGIHTIELHKRKYGTSWEIRFERPDGTTGWGQVLSDNTLSGVDLGGTPKYVRQRAIRMWRNMESVMK